MVNLLNLCTSGFHRFVHDVEVLYLVSKSLPSDPLGKNSLVGKNSLQCLSDATPSALSPSLHCASILQPAAPPQVVAFESETISAPICLNRFTLVESLKSDL